MDRVSLREAFHGEPDRLEDGTRAASAGPDEVTVHIKNGTVKFRVPKDVPDDRAIAKEYMDKFIEVALDLEDGSQLTIVLQEESSMVDVRLVPADQRDQAHDG
jgi:hypothetical protein